MIPVKAIVLNLLSVAASYGVLVLVFQHHWAERLLGFHSTGWIVSWMPVFLFVVLFGLSMDYHVFILSRVREGIDNGMSGEEALRHGIARTAGVVTSAALVMFGVFSLFATASSLDLKQAGVGLAVAVLLDATVVRAVLLPASMKLLGDRNWYLPHWLEWLPGARPNWPRQDRDYGNSPHLYQERCRLQPRRPDEHAAPLPGSRPDRDSGRSSGQPGPDLTALRVHGTLWWTRPPFPDRGDVRTKQVSLAVAALLAGAAAAWLAANRTFEPYQTASAPLALLVGWSFIGSGLAACSARPNSLLGRVMVLTGFAWFASFLTDAHQSLLFTVGTAVQSVYLVGFVYLVLTFPSGRLEHAPRACADLVWRRPGNRRRACVVAVRRFARSSLPGLSRQRLSGRAGRWAGERAGEAERIGGLSIVLVALTLITARWGRAIRAAAAQRRAGGMGGRGDARGVGGLGGKRRAWAPPRGSSQAGAVRGARDASGRGWCSCCCNGGWRARRLPASWSSWASGR